MNNYFTPSMASRLSHLEQCQQYSPQMQTSSYNGRSVNNNVIYSLVSGLDGCKMFSLPPGRVGLLFDEASNEFYIKSVDAMGMQSIKKFTYQEVELPSSNAPAIADASKIAIDGLNTRMNKIEELLQNLCSNKNVQKTVPEEKKVAK